MPPVLDWEDQEIYFLLFTSNIFSHIKNISNGGFNLSENYIFLSGKVSNL
jgi:hypothetical protein